MIVSGHINPEDLVVVAGAGGFIGGHLVAGLQDRGHRRVRAVDSKPIGQWHQRPPDVEYLQADLRSADVCHAAVDGASYVFNLAADMGGMGFIETHKADCMLSVLISTHLLLAARDQGTKRFFLLVLCVHLQLGQANRRRGNSPS
jgi:nucleoside-diphosphate-sugar epimerase